MRVRRVESKVREILNLLPERHEALLKGLLTYIPGVYRTFAGPLPSRSARFSYSVWLRHLVMAGKSGLHTAPDVVAELGPGHSLGCGIAALLTGAQAYFALDVSQAADAATNVRLFDELVRLFEAKERIPGEDEFGEGIKPYLESYDFPCDILTDTRLREALRPARLEAIRQALSEPCRESDSDVTVCYFAPWNRKEIIRRHSVDLVFSQTVMEHVDDLEGVYESLRYWLKPGGYMSHVVDFRSHGVTRAWNGHWTYTPTLWRVVRGKRPFFLNRAPLSTHLELLDANGFQLVLTIKFAKPSEVERSCLAAEFSNLSNDDLTTEAAFVQAVAP